MVSRACVLALFLIDVIGSPALAQEPAEKVLAVSKNIEFQTGDSWKDNGSLYRLYGVQSCLRGTFAVKANGEKADCGNASLAQLAALFSTAEVSCQPVAIARDKAIFVVCGAQLSSDTIDVGTALISTGYAFAATNLQGQAVNQSYLVAELDAKMKGAGLWGMSFEHPVQLLLRQHVKEGLQ